MIAFRAGGAGARMDNNADYLEPQEMLAELPGDTIQLVAQMHRVHELCSEYGEAATTSHLEMWIDESKQRACFPYEITRVRRSI